jgi:MerR family transcriptional regulator, thiopeptide resistance regulator
MEREGVQDWFRTGQFADLAGVTVRTLRYYDRVGLLKVARTRAGYRRYHLRDLERVEQIVALKFLGLSLRGILSVINGEPVSLIEALVRQRDSLLEKRQLLDRALGAIEEARSAISKGRSTTELLQKIIEVMEMQNDSSWMMKYYSPGAQANLAERTKTFTAEDQTRISQDWKEYYRDLAAMTEQGDPDGSKASELAARHRELLACFTANDPEIEAGLTALYRDRGNWPKADEDRMREYDRGT